MKKLLLIAILPIFGLSINAQNKKCATMEILEQRMKKDPSIQLRMQQSEIETQKWIAGHSKTNPKTTSNTTKSNHVITIPVVFHIIHTGEPIGTGSNISDDQIYSQLDILNEDFRLMNADSLDDTHPFWFYTADTEIEFCLAQQDPNGNATTGITRTLSSMPHFGVTNRDDIKYTADGGKDNWDPTQYLNFWTFKADPAWSILGFATFPSDLATDPDLDGVAQIYNATGIHPDNKPDNNLGRTATHEVGHWLNLHHIWGDEACGDDFCADTPEHEGENYGCPTFPHRPYNTCTPGTYENGEMYMNYMDYVNDNCMVMFTLNQSDRMDAALFGARSGLLTSDGCSTPQGIYSLNKSIDVNLYPNPSKGSFFIDLQSDVLEDISITVNNVLGEIVYQYNKQNVVKLDNFRIDINNKSNGIYFVNITVGHNVINKKIILSK